jgi:hypothetical protein
MVETAVVWASNSPAWPSSGVLAKLKKVIPKTDAGRRKGALSQGLTRNTGYPKLREHLGAAVAFMKISRDYHDFLEKWILTTRGLASNTFCHSTTRPMKMTAGGSNDEAAN